MSATRLLVLGVVRLYGQAHGYQVRRELLSWSAGSWANVKPGSIYHAIKQLAKQRLLDEVGTSGGEAGPERTVYRLTPDGETAFLLLVSRGIAEVTRQLEVLSAAHSFITVLRRGQAIGLLRARRGQLQGHQASAAAAVDDPDPLGKPAHIREMYRLWSYLNEAQLRWTSELGTPMISTRGLARTFTSRGRTVEAVRGVDIDVAAGELVGFLGPNGAGKTTTLRMLTTLLQPSSGSATVAGCDLLADPLGAYASESVTSRRAAAPRRNAPSARNWCCKAGCTDCPRRPPPRGWASCSSGWTSAGSASG